MCIASSLPNYYLLHAAAFIKPTFCDSKILLVPCPSGSTCALQILHDWFDSRLEPIAFDVRVAADSKTASLLRSLTQFVEFSVQHNLQYLSYVLTTPKMRSVERGNTTK